MSAYKILARWWQDAQPRAATTTVEAACERDAHRAALSALPIPASACAISLDACPLEDRPTAADLDATLAEIHNLSTDPREDTMSTATITVYSRPSCVQCEAVKRKLNHAGVAWQERWLDEHPEVVAEARGRGLSSAPVVVYGDTWSGGYNPEKLREFVAWATEEHAA